MERVFSFKTFLLSSCAVMYGLSLSPSFGCETVEEEEEVSTPCSPPTVMVSEESSEGVSPEVFKTDHYELDANAETVLARMQKGKDGRKRVYDPSVFPYSAQVHFKTTFHTGKGEIGSGTFIDRYIILTAGHVVYSHDKGGIYKELNCYLGGNKPYRAGNVQGVKVSRDYIANKDDWHADYALVFIDRPRGDETGYLGLSKLSNEKLSTLPVTIAGYPADKLKQEGHGLWEMSGSLSQITQRTLHYEIDTFAGQSGSGIWYDSPNKKGSYYLAGIHAYGTDEKKGYDTNRGPRLEKNLFQVLTSWIDGFNKKSAEFEFDNRSLLAKVSISSSVKKGSHESGGMDEDDAIPSDLLDKAKGGDGKALYEIGLMYQTGKAVRKDAEKALEWFTRSFAPLKEQAEKGDAEAQHKMGVIYINGRGVKKDAPEALRWYEQAAAQEYPNSQYNLGNLYASGREVKRDMKAAFTWYEKAGQNGSAEALYALGEMYKSGEKGVVDKNKEKALELWKKAAAKGHKDAQKRINKVG